jgi:histidyl-tRNA synthetase
MSSLSQPVKLFYHITAYRYEKMQKGRYREFNQFGVELFGAADPSADAEVISLLSLYFESLGIKICPSIQQHRLPDLPKGLQ